MPLKVHNNSKNPDDFEINPQLAKHYFDKLIDDAIPDNVGAAMVPGDELKTIDFSKTVDSDTISTLLPQVNGFANRMLMTYVTNPCRVKHFEVSVYTVDAKAEQLLSSCQYSFANRLAYNTCLGISEKSTLSMLYFENEVLKLPSKMIYPLSSSFPSNGVIADTDLVTGGRPQKDDSDLGESGDRMRNK